MTPTEYWQRLNELKTLTRELGEAWSRFDLGIEEIRTHLAHSREILEEAGSGRPKEAGAAQVPLSHCKAS